MSAIPAHTSTPQRLLISIVVATFILLFLFLIIGSLIKSVAWTAIPGVVGLSLCFRAVRGLLARVIPEPLEGGRLLLVLFVILIAQFVATGIGGSNRPLSADSPAADAQRVAAAAIVADQGHFAANRASVLAEVAALRKAGKLDEAMTLVRRYDPKALDPELKMERVLMAAQRARLSLANEASMGLSERAAAYMSLSRAEPGNKKLAAKAQELGKKAEQAQAAADRIKATKAEETARVAEFEAQLSKWDGSFPALERVVKESMKNPDSYEHVETRYATANGGMRVVMVFRGTNSFGGVVPQRVEALVGRGGQIVSIKDGR